MLFKNFPKKRKPLTPEYLEIYETHYKTNRDGTTKMSSASQKMERWLHKQVAKDSSNAKRKFTTLELGAGTLNQLDYEKNIEAYDIVEPFTMLYKDSKNLVKIRTIYDLIESVPENNRYDRVTSCATLEHIENLPYVVARSALLLNESGCFRASVPSEGGFLWKLAYTLTTGREFKAKYRLDYSVIMKHEHVNRVDEIVEVIKYFFNSVKIKRFGIGKHLSFYTFILAKDPDIEKCNKFLQETKNI